MAATEERYISLLTDFGFKRIFGTAPNKDLLINFLNSLFDGRKVIKKWLYALKNLANLTARPTALRDKIFDRLFQVAEIAKFTPTELREYEDSLKHYRDLKNSLDTAEEKGRAQGHAEGLVEGRAQGIKLTAKNLKTMGLSVADIIKATGLSEDDIAKL